MMFLQLVTMTGSILEGSPPGQVEAAQAVLRSRGVAIVANAAVSDRIETIMSATRKPLFFAVFIDVLPPVGLAENVIHLAGCICLPSGVGDGLFFHGLRRLHKFRCRTRKVEAFLPPTVCRFLQSRGRQRGCRVARSAAGGWSSWTCRVAPSSCWRRTWCCGQPAPNQPARATTRTS